MDVNSFDIFCLVPADFSHPGIAVAASRAGAIGVLDLEHAGDAQRVEDNFDRLLAGTRGRIGLRLTPQSLGMGRRLIERAGERELVVMLVDADRDRFESLPAGTHSAHSVFAEIRSPDDIAALGFEPDAYVAKGHEAGGWVGDDTAYILAQKLLGKVARPVHVRGGIGLHSAAGLRIAGAAGVVLDDQLLLLDESALSDRVKLELARLNGSETRLFGELANAPCRVYARPGSESLKAIEAHSRDAESGELTIEAWHGEVRSRLGWGAAQLLPLGQGIGVAAIYRERYKRVGRLVQAMRSASEQFIETANRLEHLSPGAPLAASHGTRFPIAQGPMTRVSDSPEFAVDVARGGALPFLALALMRGPQVREMLESTRRQIGDQPWGVGMLGFVPQTLRDEQCEAIWACKPSYALIAGGRPDQAAQFESRGIPTYIHAPAPALLKMYIEQGARRFVFEGRECGGHIGPIASFPLWEQMIEMLLAQAAPGSEGEFHLLFAGGIHDARSGAMIAAMTAPLAARGFKIGMLMGTAYLFTPEIVSSGAVVEGFQAQAIACRRTMSLETGPGHSTRCVDSQFAHEFYAQRRQLLREGKSADEIRDELEDLNMGRLRIASKGVNRDASGTIVDVAAEQQLSDGMYMIGQVATLRDAALPVENLHLEVSEGAAALMANWTIRREGAAAAAPSNVAIVGIGTLLPQALAADAYWNNILRQNCVLREVPKERWDWQLYFDADRTARDKVYSKWGGFLDELPFDPMIYGIPPRSMKSIDPMQLLTLEVSRRALADAGFADGGFDRENTSIILGTSGGLGDLGTQYALRAELPRFVEDLSEEVWDRLPEWTEESFAGSLLNVVAGRVANRLDFGGVNFTVDAACASSLAAISMGVNELETGRSNVVVAGGIDTVQSAFGFLCFSKTQALSPDGQPRTFDQAANGIAISEGLAVIVMKRLEDAERDGDRIYAVIKAAAGSSDGKALGMTAPRPEGQMRAIKRAYAKAGFSPATIGMAEAHGTGTPVGDRAEARTIIESLQAEGAATKSVAIGSVKTLLGHTKASAGVAGLIKVAMSLHHRTLPAHYGVDRPIDTIADPESPVYLLKAPRPWVADPRHPRRGGVSAFGFGGTNFHAVLEEYRDGYAQADVPGAESWPYELIVLRATDETGIAQQLKQLQGLLSSDRHLEFSSFAASLVRDAQLRQSGRCVAAFAARDYEALSADISALSAHVESGKPLPPHIKFSKAVPDSAPKIGLLFPGQGAQYVNMGCEPAVYLEELRAAVELADGELAEVLPQRLSRLIWPESAFTPEVETAQQKRLTQTQHAQPALGAIELGYLWFARRLGLQASAAAGHSYGEYAALMAAGVIDPKTFLRLSAIRGGAMAQASADGVAGGMAAVQADRGVVETHIAAFDGVRVANHNSPQQSVISGPSGQIDAAVKALTDADIRATRLPVSGAFHTELVAAAQAPLSAAIAGAHFAVPEFPVYSNTLGARYPDDASKARALLDRHLLSSVEFVAEIEAMYEAGIRLFLELGPKSICSNMAMATLAGKDARAVSLDGQGGGLRGLLGGIAELVVAGATLDAFALYEPRGLTTYAVAKLSQAMAAPIPSKTTWMLSGGCARALNDPEIRTGKRPALTLETRDAARAQRRARQAPPSAPVAPAASPAPLAAAATGAPVSGDAMAAYQETMRQFLALQERVIGQYLAAAAPAAGEVSGVEPAAPVAASVAAAVSAPEPMAPLATASGTRDSVDYAAVLLAIVAERTGYPEDMLGLDSDLEADLGIDSIKRVEIAGALQKQLPPDAGAQMQAGMETFTRARTLNAIIAALEALAPMAPVAAVSPAALPLTPLASTRIDYKATLLSIVAERTGYPEDMLGLDSDLEADLGIDSIKRVEIAGALQKQLPPDAGAQMQAGMETFTRARTLNAIIAALEALAPMAPIAAVAPAALPLTPLASTRIDYKATLLSIVAERTGYPEDMLGLDSDLEADLGIDSIKRVEIAGALQKQLPADAGAQMQAGMETFTRARTLNAIIAALEALAPTAVVRPPASGLRPPASPPPTEAIAEVPRYVIRPQSVPFIAERGTLSGLVLVCGGDDATRMPLMESLAAQGASVVAVDAIEADSIAASLAVARERHGPVRGVVHLYGMEPLASDSFEDWRNAGQRSVMSLFHWVQALGAELSGIRLVAATRLGGTLGRTAVGNGSVLGGGVSGLIKCLRHEYPDGRFRLVDFDGQTPLTIADYLADELLANDALPEVGYTGDARYATTTVDDALRENAFAPRLSPAADWVVLATGGARGITAELLEEIARPGMRIVLVGRSPEPPAEDARYAAAADATALRQRLIEDARASGQALKPVEFERQLSRLLAAREIRGNLLRLAACGAAVDYQACDVRDVQAFGALIDTVYDRYGRIDAVLHGAGVIEDKLLADKSVESFDRVFGTKIDSAWTLKHRLRPDSLKLLVFFSSVAGRYGNQGQSDYACANEVINRLAWQLSREWTEARVIAVNWGPWDAGMASEGVKRQFRERGMAPIPLAGGRRYFINELAYGPKNEVEVVIGQGPWQQIDGIAPRLDAPAADKPPQAMPLIRQSLRMGSGGALVLPHHFTAESDPYLDDHVINGKRVLPAAGAAEWMAQVAVEGWPGWQLAEVRDLRTLAGVVLDGDKGREVSIRARASTHSGSGEQMISVDIVEPGRKAPLYRASVRLVERFDEIPPPVPPAIQGESLDIATVYRDYLFHTGRFQLMTAIDAFSETGVDAVVRSSTPQEWVGVEGQWLLDPGLVDVAAQLAFVWVRKQHSTSALPARFGQLVRYGKAPLPATLKVLFRLRPPPHDLAIAFDAYFIDAAGDLRLAVLDSESTLWAALNRAAGHS
ncbi:SDR family NAD(P)-dependent oxidoreductase [Algiphilus sp. W345]|uniref:SDR family NAD(P)-dependent oxidoreductase n=1 Tax=Banduia mediterranea TaxID=3075609 RepID=A0ABU2WKD7_9GAMM|nr:SDR family NAD(P)-dependent oxidoreductase [Algiphilus sp. W345]MDT0497532.1 SDR family NAD(P)-dependent oxidoreductase [Algiphilus sp. W345]